MKITRALRGDLVNVPGMFDRIESQIVFSPCDAHWHAYYCEPCRLNLANVGNLVMHLDEAAPDSEHRLVAYCPPRRVYEEIPLDQLRSLAAEAA